MIRPHTIRECGFGDRSDGDGRSDTEARRRMSHELGIPDAWATIDQVHGDGVADITGPGPHGEADAAVTRVPGVPIAVATADCVPVVIRGRHSIAVVHAGWRGVVAGVVPAALARMRADDDTPVAAVVGPHIGPCCYEVGPEVVAAVGHAGTTTWGTPSVDLGAAVSGQLAPIETERVDLCTCHEKRFASFRRDATKDRQVTVAWLT